MFYWIVFQVCFQLISNTGYVFGYVKMVENGPALPIECASHLGISFHYINRAGGMNTSKTIAECDPQIKSCYLLDTAAHEQNYAAAYTSLGCILFIKHLSEETYGTYKCCETNRPSICVNKTIHSHDNIPDNSIKDSGEAKSTNSNECQMRPLEIANTVILSFWSLMVVVIFIFLLATCGQKTEKARKRPRRKISLSYGGQ